MKRNYFLVNIGAGLEYYDFIIYGMMAEYLGSLFFAQDNATLSTLKAFAIFAVGYLMRPLGGLLFGMIGDSRGRKTSILFVMLLMALSTCAIGCLPTYRQIGISAPFLLLFLRLCQGLSFGAELPGVATVVAESASRAKQSSSFGFLISSVSIGSALATFVLYLLTKNLSKEAMLDWGWRLPFLFGGTLALVNAFIRKYLQETPEFIDYKKNKQKILLKDPFIHLISFHKKECIVGIGLTCFASSLVLFSLYLPTYLSQYLKIESSMIYLSMTIGMIWSAISLPLCGFVADHFAKRTILSLSCFFFLLCVIPLFGLLDEPNFYKITAFMILYQTVLSFLSVSYFPLLSSLFPTQVRSTGIGACYNITYSLMALSPLLINEMPTMASIFLVFCALLTFNAALSIKVKSSSKVCS